MCFVFLEPFVTFNIMSVSALGGDPNDVRVLLSNIVYTRLSRHRDTQSMTHGHHIVVLSIDDDLMMKWSHDYLTPIDPTFQTRSQYPTTVLECWLTVRTLMKQHHTPRVFNPVSQWQFEKNNL